MKKKGENRMVGAVGTLVAVRAGNRTRACYARVLRAFESRDFALRETARRIPKRVICTPNTSGAKREIGRAHV